MGHDWSWTIPNYLINSVGYFDRISGFSDFFSTGYVLSASPINCHSLASYRFNFFPHTPDKYLMWFGASPITIAYFQFMLFVSIGFWSMFVFLNQVIGLSRAMAFLGAAMFMFNGFYAHRIVIGHPYHAVMLVPLLAYCLTIAPSKSAISMRHTLYSGVLAGITAYYALTYNAIIIIVPFLLTLIVLLAISLFQRDGYLSVLARSTIAMIVVVGLSYQSLQSMFPYSRLEIPLYVLSALLVVILFRRNGALILIARSAVAIFVIVFAAISLNEVLTSYGAGGAIAQRITYPFPVLRDIGTTLNLLFNMLFISPSDIEQIYREGVLNHYIAQQRHELEYGITIVPFCIIIAYLAWGGWKWLHTNEWSDISMTLQQKICATVIVLILLFPIIYTTNIPSLLPIIKNTPLINATTSPQRTYLLYVFLIPILAVIALSRFNLRKWAWLVVIISAFGVVINTAWKDREYYHAQPYNPLPIQQAHSRLKEGWKLPKIESVNILTDGAGGLVHDQTVEANLFLDGVQHMGCYIPGYSSVATELLGTLHPGSIWDVTDGYFNLKNPACNSWASENNCRPGEHFKVDQRQWMQLYVSHNVFPMQTPGILRRATEVSAFAYYAIAIFMLGAILQRLIVICRMYMSR